MVVRWYSYSPAGSQLSVAGVLGTSESGKLNIAPVHVESISHTVSVTLARQKEREATKIISSSVEERSSVVVIFLL